jgi:Aerotolerance regulator N-terminal/von Willebrand factor type A domain
MSFLSPFALAGLILLSLPVLIHLLAKRRARPIDFPSLRYLRETPSFRLRPRRIRQPLLLALRLLALVLLVMGVARPLIKLRTQSSRVRLILIDASLSMSAKGRTAAAKEAARALINRLALDEQAAVVSCSSEANVLANITRNRQELLDAVERYQPSSGAIDFNKGLAKAAALLEHEASSAAEIDLISDFQESNLSALVVSPQPLPARVITHPVGSIIERNAFLLGESISQNESGPVLAASEMIAEAEGRSGSRYTWAMNANTGERPDINWRTEVNGQLTGRIRTLAPDDFDMDDERCFAFMPTHRDAHVLLVAADAETSLYTGAALEAATNNPHEKHSLLTRQKRLPETAAGLNSYALVALTLHGALSADELQRLNDYAEAGGTVWLSMARDADVAALNAQASTNAAGVLPFRSLSRRRGDAALHFGTADLSAPPLRAMTENSFAALRAVKVYEGYALEPKAGADTLMRWSNGTPAFVSVRTSGGGRIMLLGVSTESASSDMGSSPAFPSLVFSLLREATTPRKQFSYALGEPVNLGLAPETSVTVTYEGVRVARVASRDLMQQPLSVFPAQGIYRLEYEGVLRFVALNPPGAESERALAGAVEAGRYFDFKETLKRADVNERLEEAERSGNAWRYFLAAAFVLLVGELFVRAHQREKERAMVEEVASATQVELKL